MKCLHTHGQSVCFKKITALLKKLLLYTYTCGGIYCDWTWNERLAIIQTNKHIDWAVERKNILFKTTG